MGRRRVIDLPPYAWVNRPLGTLAMGDWPKASAHGGRAALASPRWSGRGRSARPGPGARKEDLGARPFYAIARVRGGLASERPRPAKRPGRTHRRLPPRSPPTAARARLLPFSRGGFNDGENGVGIRHAQRGDEDRGTGERAAISAVPCSHRRGDARPTPGASSTGPARDASGSARAAGPLNQTKITPYRDGPYLVRGPFSIVDQDGTEIEVKRRVVALCRCGRSQMRPFCDGTHKAIGFRAESGLPGPVPAELPVDLEA